MYGHATYGSEGEHIGGGREPMKAENGNGSKRFLSWEWLGRIALGVIGTLLLILANGMSAKMDNVASNQESMKTAQAEIKQEVKDVKDSLHVHEAQTRMIGFLREQYHHQNIRSCADCKSIERHEKFQVPVPPAYQKQPGTGNR